MPRYEVIVTRDATESITVEVAARTPAEAEEKAREEAELNSNLKWELDEGNYHRPYTNGAELVSETEYRDRADLTSRPAWRGMDTDTSGNPLVWLNYYDGYEDVWSCQCDVDDEPPLESEWVGPADPAEILLWESLPEAGQT